MRVFWGWFSKDLNKLKATSHTREKQNYCDYLQWTSGLIAFELITLKTGAVSLRTRSLLAPSKPSWFIKLSANLHTQSIHINYLHLESSLNLTNFLHKQWCSCCSSKFKTIFICECNQNTTTWFKLPQKRCLTDAMCLAQSESDWLQCVGNLSAFIT